MILVPWGAFLGNIVSSDQFRAAFRAQSDALEIEALAKRRLADAAQERGEARKRGGNDKVTKLPDGKFGPCDIGLNDKQLHEARTIRDAEARDPGVVWRTVDAAIAAGKEPTKARGRPPQDAVRTCATEL